MREGEGGAGGGGGARAGDERCVLALVVVVLVAPRRTERRRRKEEEEEGFSRSLFSANTLLVHIIPSAACRRHDPRERDSERVGRG